MFAAEQRIELARPIERGEDIIAAHMGRTNKNLPQGQASISPRPPLASRFRVAAHVDLGEVDALARQQPLGRVAMRAVAGGVNLDHDARSGLPIALYGR